MGNERITVFNPLDPKEAFPFYKRARKETFPLVEQAQTNAEKLCLWYALSQAKIMRPLLEDTDALEEKGLLTPIGGPSDNPHKPIDYIGADIAKSMLPYFLNVFGSSAHVHIEEENWKSFKRSKKTDTIINDPFYIVVDPLDETSQIGVNKYQTTGMIVANSEGTPVAGVIASLNGEDILLVSSRGSEKPPHVSHFSYDAQNNSLTPKQIIEKSKSAVERLRIATLQKRLKDPNDRRLAETHLFDSPNEHIPTFGGFGVLEILNGNLDAMVDPFKGQPWYEAVVWGAIAQMAGLKVTDASGNDLNYAQIIHKSREPVDNDVLRVPIIISKDANIHEIVKTLVSPYRDPELQMIAIVSVECPNCESSQFVLIDSSEIRIQGGNLATHLFSCENCLIAISTYYNISGKFSTTLLAGDKLQTN